MSRPAQVLCRMTILHGVQPIAACRIAAMTAAAMALVMGLRGAYAADKPALRVVRDTAGRPAALEGVGVYERAHRELSELEPDAAEYSQFLAVRVADDAAPADQPAMLGTYALAKGVLRFTPRFAFRPGLRYRAAFSPDGNIPREPPEFEAEDLLYVEFEVPDAAPRAAAEVVRIYPSSDTLPENQLRFYIHFATPMRRGEAYERLRLRKRGGELIFRPFLELGEELWDDSGRRLTLLIDPGRIKRGVAPREDLGTVLEEGSEYLLEVSADWKDAAGRRLSSDFVKEFRVGPPVESALDPGQWRIEPPRAGTTDSLIVRFPLPLDHALLERTIRVSGPQSRRMRGTVTIAEEETLWAYVPDRPWQSGAHRLDVETVLEDLVGNRIGRPFEVDQTDPIRRTEVPETVAISFEVPALPP